MFGTMDPFKKYMAKTLSSVDSRGKAVDQLVASLESGHAKHSTKIKKLEKRADKHDTEQVCMVFNTSLSAPGALAHSLQRRTACNIQNGRQRAPKWPMKGVYCRLLGTLKNSQ